ncbi:repressor [Burkholderia phage JC1]|nr:repressor [Burkholderia phage JC1]
MPHVNKDYFDELLKGRRMSLRALATKMGMSHSQLSLTFGDKRKMQLDEAAQISQIFGVPFNEVAANAGVNVRPSSGRRISVIGHVGAGGTLNLNDTIGTVERAEAPDDLPDDAVAIQCRTADTPLSWMDGWVMFCSKPNGLSQNVLGRFCAAKLRDGPAVIATLKRGYREGTFNLSGPFTRDSCELEWATPLLVARF